MLHTEWGISAGRERPDGNDETTLEGTEEDSSFPAGFWHPYGRGNDSLPPSRVVCFSPEAVAQVTLQFPSLNVMATAQVQSPPCLHEEELIANGV